MLAKVKKHGLLRWLLAFQVAATSIGCTHHRGGDPFQALEQRMETLEKGVESAIVPASYEEEVSQISYVEAAQPAPFALDSDPDSVNYWDLSLDEAIQTGLANSSVLRDLGAQILQSPALTDTVYGPSLQATDPRFGVEAALSAFDAQFNTRAFFEKNDRFLNNSLLGGGTNLFQQDLWRVQSEISKRAATGANFSLRHNVEDDLNNAPANLFGTRGTYPGHAWNWNWEAEVRQPLLQGAGADFNRIAGPDAIPGVANGVVIARVNTEISAADFQIAIRDYLSNIENAYWDLVYAYRELDIKKRARQQSLDTWQKLKGRKDVADEPGNVAQAAEQYFRFEQEVETALSGRLTVGTRDFNGSTGGTFQGTGGVYVAERRLRLMMGLPINDGRLIRPVTPPQPAPVELDWHQAVQNAIAQRTELVQQRLRIKRRSLELRANRNFLLPDLDVVGRYRRRGLGNSLYDPSVPAPGGGASPPFVDSGTDEWQFGLELEVPIGYRQANSAVRNSELELARERAVLGEMERQIVHDLSNAVADLKRVYQLVKTTYNRRQHAEEQYKLLTSPEYFDASEANFSLVLDAERRMADADTAYQAALVSYAVALKNLQLEQGSLMNYCNVQYADAGL